MSVQHHEKHQSQGREDAGALREAIQENVKNLIFVLTATVSIAEHQKLFCRHPSFWAATKDLLRPFEFGPILLEHLKVNGFIA
jgi:hypothetical protein